MDEVKKRGRRPKLTISPSVEVIDSTKINTNVVVANPKKGRKPKNIYNSAESSILAQPNLSNLSDDENIIVKLDIKNTITCVDDLDEDHPYAYNSKDYTNISTIQEESIISSLQETISQKPDNNNNNRVLELLKDFEEKNKNNEWPSNTSIACYWCCHKFNNSPFGIPLNYKNEKFEVMGCFCSLECAASYNFKNNDNVDEMWERYNLINLMCRKMTSENFVKPAPDILSLKLFGGHLEIEKFREYFKTNRVININFPPMTSITQQLEEINENELTNEYKFIPIDNERINKYKEKILFKRNKPLINNSNSLENTMKLTYN